MSEKTKVKHPDSFYIEKTMSFEEWCKKPSDEDKTFIKGPWMLIKRSWEKDTFKSNINFQTPPQTTGEE